MNSRPVVSVELKYIKAWQLEKVLTRRASSRATRSLSCTDEEEQDGCRVE